MRRVSTLPRPGGPLRVLVVGECPEIDPATERLRRFTRALHLRSDTEVSSLWLVNGSARRAWTEACDHELVLDDLREWAPAALADRLGARLVAGKLRGLRWRRQLARLGQFDIAVVDQGRGTSMLAQLPHRPAVVVTRVSDDPPPVRSDATPMALDPARVLVDGGSAQGDEFDLHLDGTAAWIASLPVHREATRSAVAPGAQVLVVGTGVATDPNGALRFREVLEASAAGTDLAMSGCWIDGVGDDDSQDGVAMPSVEGQDALAAGDVLVMLGDEAVPRSLVMNALCCGVPVLGSPGALAEAPEDELVTVVTATESAELAPLLLALVPLTDNERFRRMESARLRWDVSGRAAQFVDLGHELLGRGGTPDGPRDE